MAFCQFCGREIPDGSVCGCPGSQQAAAQNQQQVNNEQNQATAPQQGQPQAPQQDQPQSNGQAPQQDQPQSNGQAPQQDQPQNQFNNAAQNAQAQFNNAAQKVEGIAGDLSENLPGNMKGNKNIVYIAGAAIVLVLLIIIIACCSGGGAKGTAKKFAKSLTKANGAKTYYSLTLPDEYIDDLKDEDEWDDKLEDYNDSMEDTLDDIKIKIKKIEKKDKLSKKELKGVEEYFDYIYDCSVDVTKGYEFKIKLQANDDGDKDTTTQRICVVKVKGEGWKVITTEASYLKDYAD